MPPAAAEHTVGFAIEARAIGDVHRHMLGPCDVKALVAVWQHLGVRALVDDFVCEARARGKIRGCLDEAWAEIDASPVAIEGRSEIARRTPQPPNRFPPAPAP